MKILILLLIFLSKESPSSDFIHGMDDIPIFKKMEYVEDSFVLFDKVDGRYVSSEVSGDYTQDEVVEFYDKILPNFGWDKVEYLKFKRGREILEIETKMIKNKISVILSIYPGK